ncbi:MAG: hypothetical protein WD423_07305 [Rhodothermales bacterium]
MKSFNAILDELAREGIAADPQSLTDARILEALSNFEVFWAADYDSHKIREGVLKALAEIQITSARHHEWSGIMQRRLGPLIDYQDAKFFYNLASDSLSRAKALSSLKAFERMRTAQYQIVAALDKHTTDICRCLDLMYLSVDDAVTWRNQFMGIARSDQSWRQIAERFWVTLTPEDVARIDDPSDVASQGVFLPPFHDGCRSIIEPVL